MTLMGARLVDAPFKAFALGSFLQCVGEKVVKLGVRDRESPLREVPVSATEGHLSRFFTRSQESRSCDLLAEKYS